MRNRTISFVLLLLVVCALQGCALYLRKNFVGHVFERESQKPVAGVTVVAEYAGMMVIRPDPVVTKTDERGRFEIKIPNNDATIITVGAVSRVVDGQTVWEGGEYFGPTTKWYRDHGGWLEGVGYPRIVVWFAPASKETPPDFSDINNPIPPYRRGAERPSASTVPGGR